MSYRNWRKLTEIQWKVILDEEQRRLFKLPKDTVIKTVK